VTRPTLYSNTAHALTTVRILGRKVLPTSFVVHTRTERNLRRGFVCMLHTQRGMTACARMHAYPLYAHVVLEVPKHHFSEYVSVGEKIAHDLGLDVCIGPFPQVLPAMPTWLWPVR
jgi:hypothetical protein